ncbi:MAG: UDP-2,4-diacetamido-2,4,6-trideoxy-beta-L-altropyranose hydrolase [Cognaticolwellia sp.]|jgi:UDP-2,4-diacetamido-2,4,6-trideoxy-beta-L-altropyranose hydrolase
MHKSILFRFDASSDVGLGHAFRCMALIEHIALSNNDNKLQCIVIVNTLPEFIYQQLLTMSAIIYKLPEKITIKQEIMQVSSIKDKYKAQSLVLDGYQFNVEYRCYLAQLALIIIAFDDINDLPHLHCNIVINALSFAENIGYQRSAPIAEYLLGMKYSIVRQEYLSVKSIPYIDREKLLINFGGSDIGKLTLPVIKALAESVLKVSAQNVVVVTGGGCEDVSQINLLCHQQGYQHIQQCSQMAVLLNQCKMAICAPGSIVYELAYSKVPSLFLTVAQNQELSARSHQEAGWSYMFNGKNESSVTNVMKKIESLWTDNVQLNKMSLAASLLIDGKGVKRIVERIKDKMT